MPNTINQSGWPTHVDDENWYGIFRLLIMLGPMTLSLHQNKTTASSITRKWLSLIARFMGPTWGPSGADRTQVSPMLAPWTLLSGMFTNTKPALGYFKTVSCSRDVVYETLTWQTAQFSWNGGNYHLTPNRLDILYDTLHLCKLQKQAADADYIFLKLWIKYYR